MVVAAVLDGEGRPLCCELWPGNTTDVTTLVPIVDRLRSRFGIRRICIVADRGMISKKTIEELESPGGVGNISSAPACEARKKSGKRSFRAAAGSARSIRHVSNERIPRR